MSDLYLGQVDRIELLHGCIFDDDSIRMERSLLATLQGFNAIIVHRCSFPSITPRIWVSTKGPLVLKYHYGSTTSTTMTYRRTKYLFCHLNVHFILQLHTV